MTKQLATVADSIEMTRFGDPYYNVGGSANGIVANFSPDGKQFAVVLRRGDLRTNRTEYSLVLFKTSEVFHAGQPRKLLSMSSTSNRPGIHNVVWLRDNDTLLFLGETPGQMAQLYSFRCSSQQLRKLTNHPSSLTTFAATTDGKNVVYVAENPDLKLMNPDVGKNGFEVTSEWLADLLSGSVGKGQDGKYSLFIKRSDPTRDQKVELEGRVDYADDRLMALSPDGAHLLVQTTTMQVPDSWVGYEDPFFHAAVHHRTLADTAIPQYELVDTRRGKSVTLSDSPFSPTGSEMAWGPDSKSLVVSQMYLPLGVSDPKEEALRKKTTFLVEYKIPNREFSILSHDDLRLLGWDRDTGAVICDVGRVESLNGKRTAKVYFEKQSNRWSRIDKLGEPPKMSLPRVVLEENMNEPPTISVISEDKQQKSVLLDLNPQFHNLTLATVEEVSWNSSHGDIVKGGLYWPPNYEAKHKYPLVIQTHGWVSNRFWMDGAFPTAFAAQPLAAQGFFVLQLDEVEDWHLFGTPEEAPTAVADYESAIDYLDSRGLIDRSRVGLIGFSRTCYYVTEMLVFSHYPIAAAVIADGIDADYFQYLAFSNESNDWAASIEALNGGAPYGDALESWMKRVSAFHLDKVRTPLRIQALGPVSLLTEWNWYSGLRTLGKPVDLIYLPDGAHILEKPWERMASEQGDVDWFCFWMKGQQDPDPTKAEQYRHWRFLRDTVHRSESARNGLSNHDH